jgi:hypothetical protein
MTEPTRSPIREKPLRQPGQSLLEERERIVEDQVAPWFVLALFFTLLAGWEWFAYLQPRRPNPVFVSAVALAIAAFAAWRVLRWRPRLRAIRLGIEGERVVGQYLDRMRGAGYRVFHDVVAEGFNLDHILVGPAGVFTIETKTISKPARGDARVSYDGAVLRVAGFEPDRDPIVQAKAQARWLSALITDSTERRVFVRPVVVFPGWYVDAAEDSRREVWVLEPKALPAFIEREPERLNKEEVALMAKCISMHVRAREREQAGKGPLV